MKRGSGRSGLGPCDQTNSDSGEMEHASAHEVVERLQQQVLDEYKLTARNLDDVAAIVQRLSSAQPHLLSELRPLEQKLGLILTLFKASVWSLLRQREDQQL
ncbi:DASH complex, subunit Dad3 [Rhodotorula toruloides]|nr:DASH complex, subunit Dad3 [Rhodotorula toruloides]